MLRDCSFSYPLFCTCSKTLFISLKIYFTTLIFGVFGSLLSNHGNVELIQTQNSNNLKNTNNTPFTMILTTLIPAMYRIHLKLPWIRFFVYESFLHNRILADPLFFNCKKAFVCRLLHIWLLHCSDLFSMLHGTFFLHEQDNHIK